MSNGAAGPWNPNANAPARAVAAGSGGVVYVGGDFTNVGGLARNRLASLNNTTGAASTWNPNANNSVTTLLVSGGELYVGGRFTAVGGQARNHLAAFDVIGLPLSSWNPNPDGNVNAMAAGPSGLLVGGSFANVGGQPRKAVAELDVSTGLATAWNPGPDGQVSALAVSGSSVYLGGTFATIGKTPQANLAFTLPLSLVGVPWVAPRLDLALELSPNPAPGVVRLRYVLPDAATVEVSVYDLQGRRVARPVSATIPAGSYSTTWDPDAGPDRLAPGVYFVRMTAGVRRVTQRLVRVR